MDEIRRPTRATQVFALTDLLLLLAKLLLLEANTLARKLLRKDRGVPEQTTVRYIRERTMENDVLGVGVDSPGKLLSTVRLVQHVVSERLQVCQVSAAN